MKQNLSLIDSTLRDGEQAPGVVFSQEEKIQIAIMLDQLGIEIIEAGIPSMNKKEMETMSEIVKLKLNCNISMWSRAVKKDIEETAKTGCDTIHISFPVSDIHLSAMGKNKKWLLDSVNETLQHASNYFRNISLGAMDASRANYDDLFDFLVVASSFHLSRLRVADTVGILSPFSVVQLISKIKNSFPTLPLEFHGHNDLGMATANTISAIHAGCEFVSTTINGLGERAGNAPTEEVIMALKHSMGIEINYQTENINQLCAYVSKASNTSFAANKPIVGEKVLMHESGIHTRCLLENKKTFQIIEAAEIGRKEEEFVFGKHSGTSALIDYYKRRAIEITKSEAQILNHKIKAMSEKLKRQILPAEIDQLRFTNI